MQYYCAPMEGYTDATYRTLHAEFFGQGLFSGAADRYYAPFASPTFDNRLDPRMLRDIAPENNPGPRPVPQVLCKQAGPFVWFARQLAEMGYTEVNLNAGCPAGTVVAKGKGSGLLRTPEGPDSLDELLDGIFSADLPLKISVKTRLGIHEETEFDRVLEVYNRYPISELIIHPRLRSEYYHGAVHTAAFEKALAASRCPVCYNGDLVTAADCTDFAAAHPTVPAEMLGRGLLANPAVLRQARGGSPLTEAELRDFMQQLYERYVERFGGPQNAIRRMKGYWTYVLGMFDDHAKEEKQLRRANDADDYRLAVGMIFGRLTMRTDATNAWQTLRMGGR